MNRGVCQRERERGGKQKNRVASVDEGLKNESGRLLMVTAFADSASCRGSRRASTRHGAKKIALKSVEQSVRLRQMEFQVLKFPA